MYLFCKYIAEEILLVLRKFLQIIKMLLKIVAECVIMNYKFILRRVFLKNTFKKEIVA